MSPQHDSRRRLPAFLIRRLAQRSPPLDGCSTARAPPFPRAGYRDPTVALPAFLRGKMTLWRCTVIAVPSNSRSRPAGSPCGPCDSWQRVPSRFGPRRASLRGCQMCAVLGRFCPGVKVSMIAVRVPRPFLLARPRRPRFGMSDRRPSSLRAASLLPPQQPVTIFFPWPLRVHSSRKTRKSRPGCPLLRAGPFGVRVDRLRSVASHRGRDGRGPGN